jgi:predicted metal-dependent phosphoesterase TrpH
MYKKGDFHIHTNYSDGKYSPKEIIEMAKKYHVDIIAITDHDTVAGIREAVKAGIENGIKVIPGIELSTLRNGESIHVIGYFKDEVQISRDFRNYLDQRQIERLKRAEEIVRRLDKFFSIKLDIDKIIKGTNGIIARPHIAKAILEAGYDLEWSYIFDHIIGENSLAYVPNKKLSTEEGLELLSTVNALTVLAHPVLVKDNDVEELLKLGFDGIEAKYHLNSEEDTKKYLKLALDLGKIVTAGSDFHGLIKTDVSHSDEIGTVCLEEKDINIFLNSLNKKSGTY